MQVGWVNAQKLDFAIPLSHDGRFSQPVCAIRLAHRKHRFLILQHDVS